MFSKKIAATLLLLGLVKNQCSATNVGKNFDSQIVKNVGCAVAGVLGGMFGTLLVQQIAGKDKKQEQNPGEPSVKVTDEVVCRCILDYENKKAKWEISANKNLSEKIENSKDAIAHELKMHEDAVKRYLYEVEFKNSNTDSKNKKISFDYEEFIKSLRNCAKSGHCDEIKRLILASKGVFEVRKNSDGSYFCWYAVKNLDGQFERRNFHDMVGDSREFMGVFGYDKKVYTPDDDYGLESKELNFKITEEYFDKLVGNEKK